MIIDLSDKNKIKKAESLCLHNGKINSQLILSEYGLPIPESLLVHNLSSKDLNVVKKFIEDPFCEYQIRSEGITGKVRYSDSSTGLSKKEFIPELLRMKENAKLLLVQKLPYNCLDRDVISCQYTIYNDQLVLELRAGIATHIARCGWPPSEYCEIPVTMLDDLDITDDIIKKFCKVQKKEILKTNLFLDCMDAGLKHICKNGANPDVLKLPWHDEYKRGKRIYELSRYELGESIKRYWEDRKEFESFFQDLIDQVKKEVVSKFLKTYKIPRDISKLKLKELLAVVGFVDKYREEDKLDTLRKRVHNFVKKGIFNERIANNYLFLLINHALKIKELLIQKIAKLSLIQTEDGMIILYWDLAPWKKSLLADVPQKAK